MSTRRIARTIWRRRSWSSIVTARSGRRRRCIRCGGQTAGDGVVQGHADLAGVGGDRAAGERDPIDYRVAAPAGLTGERRLTLALTNACAQKTTVEPDEQLGELCGDAGASANPGLSAAGRADRAGGDGDDGAG